MKWFENPDNFPALITTDGITFVVVHYFTIVTQNSVERLAVADLRDHVYFIDKDSNWRLASRGELLTLHTEGSL